VEYEHDGYTYKLTKLGLGEAKEYLAKMIELGFFDEPMITMLQHSDEIERRMFRGNLQLLNEQGDWIPMGKELTASHFNGRVDDYFHLLWKAVDYNFASFLSGGWTTGLVAAAEPEE